MLEEDIDDTHLCIKCSQTIVGLDNYIQHRKTNCSSKPTEQIPRESEHVDHRYRNFDFPETPNYHKSEETEKANNNYDIPYDLGADVFFSSLELQSSSRKTINNSTAVSSSGKHGSTSKMLTRKASAALLSHHEPNDAWISPSNNTDNLMKAVNDISGTKKCDNLFLVPFQHDSPELSEEEDEDDEVYGASPPSSHTGGKWKPGNTISPTILRTSPAWDERPQWDAAHHDFDKPSKTHDNEEFDHELIPPPGHTKGKWVPGTKIVKLDYKEEVEVEKIFTDQYWCNTCNRKLSTKLLYERHIKSSLHMKRSEPEQELEQARLKLPKISERIKKRSIYLNDTVYFTENSVPEEMKPPEPEKKVRKRRKYFTKCETCKVRLRKSLLGKHLISHYHYRRMSRHPAKAFDLVLKYIEKIVHQAPYQCQPCRFYTNTQDDFMNHWNSGDHGDIVEGPGRFCCNFCKFECEDNNQMRRHLLGQDHMEVILAINGSVPIIIGKRIVIECPKCKQGFRYNIELRKHAEQCTREPSGTASNDYQSKFICHICKTFYKSQLALQKHKIQQHKSCSFFCSLCKIEFAEAIEAKRHRSSALHRVTAASMKNATSLTRKCKICGEELKNILELRSHIEDKHPDAKHSCPYCGKKFLLSQEVSRHIRDKGCPSAASKVIPAKKKVERLALNIKQEDSAEEYSKTCQLEDAEKEVLKEYSCNQCEFSSHLKAEYIYHEILHGFKNTDINSHLPCSICHKSFRKYSLRYHLRQHTNERVFQCEQCPMKFSRKYNLKTHLDNVHIKMKKERDGSSSGKGAVYKCTLCEKCFNTKHCLKQHETVHKERDKRFKCPVEGCIYIARSSGELKIHWSAHTTEKIFPCENVGCNYKGKTITLLKRHMKIHQPINKTFDCPHCEFKAKIPGHLKRHMRIHTGEKPYKCPHCSFQCNTSENLRKHVLTTSLHVGRSLYECQYCDPISMFKTNFQKDYRAHLILAHHDESHLLEN